MNFARSSISATTSVIVYDARFDANAELFATTTPAGFAIYRVHPLTLIRKRELTGGTLAAVLPCHSSSLLFLLGGGRSPLYPPNKVVLWDDVAGKEVAELEFRERVRGFACRRGWLAVALRRRVVVFEVGDQLSRFGEWDTSDNPRGLLALASASFSTLLAMPGRQVGHVQLVHLPQCRPPAPLGPPPPGPPLKPPPPPSRHPVSIVAAHTSSLATLTVTTSGRLLATTSAQGTLVRVWDTQSGKCLRQLRRGVDKADIYGVAFRTDEQELCVWSDKGTIHVFAVAGGTTASNKQSSLSPLAPFIPLPKYFESEWSYAQYRLPTQSAHISLSQTSIRTPGRDPDVVDDERCVVAWIVAPAVEASKSSSGTATATPAQHQLVALTWTGGWYRLSLPGVSATIAASPTTGGAGSGSSAASTAAGQRVPLSASPPTRTPVLPLPPARPVSTIQSGRPDKGKGKEREKDKERDKSRGSTCTLQEFRKFGRFDGWL